MTGWNLPPGCSGQEYEIAGPDAEWEESLWCNECDRITLFTCQSYRNTYSAACAICDREHPTWSEEREQFEDGLLADNEWDEDLDWLLEDGCVV